MRQRNRISSESTTCLHRGVNTNNLSLFFPNTATRTLVSGGDYCALTRFQYALHHGFACFFVCTPPPTLSSSSIHQDPIQYFAVNWMLEPITHSAAWVANTAWT